jgi:hypothetical protein
MSTIVLTRYRSCVSAIGSLLMMGTWCPKHVESDRQINIFEKYSASSWLLSTRSAQLYSGVYRLESRLGRRLLELLFILGFPQSLKAFAVFYLKICPKPFSILIVHYSGSSSYSMPLILTFWQLSKINRKQNSWFLFIELLIPVLNQRGYFVVISQ